MGININAMKRLPTIVPRINWKKYMLSLPTLPGMETRETAEMPDPIMPKATRNHGDSLLPSKKVVSRVCLDVRWEMNINNEK